MGHRSRSRRSRSRSRSRSPRRPQKHPKRSHRGREERKEKSPEPESAAHLGGYTNAENPFGDADLSSKFVWKKREHEIKRKGQRDKIKRNQQEVLEEIEKVKRRRAERELEREERDKEMELKQREREAELFKGWHEKEGDFHVKQASIRSAIRIKQGRSTQTDLLSRRVGMWALSKEICDPTTRAEMEKENKVKGALRDLRVGPHSKVPAFGPGETLQGLDLAEQQEMLTDMKELVDARRARFDLTELEEDLWREMIVLTEAHIARKREDRDRDEAGRGPAHAFVLKDIHAMFDGLSYKELDVKVREIQDALDAGEAPDAEFFDYAASVGSEYRARARLKEIHEELLKGELALIAEVKVIAAKRGKELAVLEEKHNELRSRGMASDLDRLHTDSDYWWIVEERRRRRLEAEEGDVRPAGFVNEDDLGEDRIQVHTGTEASDIMRTVAEDEGAEGIVESEERVDTVVIKRKDYSWQDKYRPRKPKSYNRIRTAFEWSKYNRAHYDDDNPPPKVVRGYRFNIFYPDLIDKTKSPSYSIHDDEEGGSETRIIVFHAGAPYEDIAFRVVNGEWETSHRRGFRCVFDRGVLQLSFGFRRNFYRR